MPCPRFISHSPRHESALRSERTDIRCRKDALFCQCLRNCVKEATVLYQQFPNHAVIPFYLSGNGMSSRKTMDGACSAARVKVSLMVLTNSQPGSALRQVKAFRPLASMFSRNFPPFRLYLCWITCYCISGQLTLYYPRKNGQYDKNDIAKSDTIAYNIIG